MRRDRWGGSKQTVHDGVLTVWVGLGKKVLDLDEEKFKDIRLQGSE